MATISEKMTAIADAIRTKTGGTGTLNLDGMANALNNIPDRETNDLTASGATVTIPAGNYKTTVSKSVATTTQAIPSISIDAYGKISATATQSAGYVSAGSKTGTKQMTVQVAKTVTPTKSSQTAVASGRYTIGKITVAPIPNKYQDITTLVDTVCESGLIIPKITADFIERNTIDFLPESLTTIGKRAFQDYTNLTLTSLPKNLTSIQDYAFYGCTNLALTSLPDNITTISNYAFENCTNLALTSLPENITTINSCTFRGCTNLALTSLPENITSISTYAFADCTNLALTSLPDNITTIPHYAFQNCINLALTSLPKQLSTIGPNAFQGCSNLRTITFKGTPTTISVNSFSDCPNLITINVPWSEGAVANAPWGATNATINYNYVEV